MKPWQQVLRDDPVEPLTADETALIRRIVIVEARSMTAAVLHPLRLTPVFALGSALMVAVIAGVFVARAQPDAEPSAVSAPGDMRQLQFATPGGTRVIWQFNPNFSLRETHP